MESKGKFPKVLPLKDKVRQYVQTNSMNLENFEINDFLMDESFYNWVKHPGSDDSLFWESWLNDHPSKREAANQAKMILKSLAFQQKNFSKTEITDLWNNIQAQTIEDNQVDKYTGKQRRLTSWSFLKVAAVMLPFIIASVLFLFYRQAPIENMETVFEKIEKYNPQGQKLTVFLSDGSKVKLNAESRLTYTKPFDDEKWVVYLEGDAFFEVATDAEKPFIVRTGDLETTVLGTSFNVKAYPKDGKIDVAVKTGKVSVSAQNLKQSTGQSNSVVLSPTEMASYSQKENQFRVSVFDEKEVLSWSDGTLYFNNASMEEFVAKLERWYGIEIVVARKTPVKKGIVGEFKDLSLEEILMGTHEASEFSYEFKKGKVIIR